MKSLSKSAAIFPLVCVFICALVLLTAVLAAASPSVAHAEQTDFDILLPEDGYFPVTDATLLAANDTYLAVYDAASGNILVASHDFALSSHIDVSAYEDIGGMWLSGSVLLFSYGSVQQFACVDIVSRDAAVSPADGIKDPQNVSYIAADDSRFYIKYATSLSVYSSSDFSVIREDITHSAALSGQNIFTAEDMCLYIYAAEYGVRGYYVLNLDEVGSPDKKDTAVYPYSVAMANETLFTATESGILAVNRNDGEALFSTGIAASEETVFAAGGNNLYVINASGGVDVYSVDLPAQSVTLTRTLSMNGSGEGQFDSPADVLITSAGLIVADGGNSRVAVFGENSVRYVAVPDAPVALASTSQDVTYAATRTEVYRIMPSADGTLAAVVYCGVPEGETVVDIVCAGNGLVILTDANLYTYSLPGSIRHIMSVENGIALSGARNDVVYLMTDAGLYTLSAAGVSLSELIPFREYSFAGATDIAADYAGNLFVSYRDENKIVRFSNQLSAVAVSAEFDLGHSLYTASPVAFVLDGSRAVFASSACFIGSAEVGATDESSYTPLPDPDPDEAETLSFAAFSRDTYLFDEPGRFDTMYSAPAGTVVLCYDGISAQEGYTYVYFGGRTGYIENDALSPVSPSPMGGTYTLAAGTALRTHPAADETLTFESDALVTVTDDAAALDNGAWVRISYGGATYFAPADSVTEYVEPVPERKQVFGRASADRAGGLVGIYSLPDSSSAPVLEVVDGTRMEILDESGEYWLVSVEGTVGYAAKSDVELEGLTTVQIVSIVLCCAVAVTGVVIFVITWQARKKEKEKE